MPTVRTTRTRRPSPATRRRVVRARVQGPLRTRRPYFLVLDTGTFCDHRLFDTAVRKLRDRYRLVYLTTPGHKLPPADIKQPYDVPAELLENAGEVATAMTSGTIFSQAAYVVTRFARTQSPLFTNIVAMSQAMVRLLHAAIAKYRPVGLLAHCGCLPQVLMAGRLDVPTSVLYFAPGFLPNHETPFAFDNALQDPGTDVFAANPLHKECARRNVTSGLGYQDELRKRMPIADRVEQWHHPYAHLANIQHLNTFGPPLVPPMTYADALPPMTVESVGLMRPNLPTTPLDDDLAAWVKHARRGKGKVVFVSFGSILHALTEHRVTPDAPTSVLETLLTSLQRYAETHDAHVLVHDDKQCLSGASMDTIRTMTRVRIWSTFVAYPTLVPLCSLVCFTGSVCLQNVCWANRCPMLYVPVLPEQFLWAKLYRRHTRVPFVDYLRDDGAAMTTALTRAFAWARTKGATALFDRVAASIPTCVEDNVVARVEAWGAVRRCAAKRTKRM